MTTSTYAPLSVLAAAQHRSLLVAIPIGSMKPGENSFGQKTRRGQSPTEQSRFLLLINVSASVAFNELVVEPLYDLGPIEELCNQGENPKQNHHCHASRA